MTELEQLLAGQTPRGPRNGVFTVVMIVLVVILVALRS
jgi:hypothetical protein